MPANNRSAGTLSQNPQKIVIATYICFVTNFTDLRLTNIQANYWVGQMHCGPAHPTALPPCCETQYANSQQRWKWWEFPRVFAPRLCRNCFDFRAARSARCTWAVFRPCRSWRTGTACRRGWKWWARSRSHRARSARTPSSSDRTFASWTSPASQKRNSFFTVFFRYIFSKLFGLMFDREIMLRTHIL